VKLLVEAGADVNDGECNRLHPDPFHLSGCLLANRLQERQQFVQKAIY
jgi:hypothetical protein